MATLKKVEDVAAATQRDAVAEAARARRVAWLRYVLLVAVVIFGLSALGFAVRRFALGRRAGGWVFGAGATAAALVLFGALAYLSLDNPKSDLLTLVGLDDSPSKSASPPPTASPPAPKAKGAAQGRPKIDWAAALKPRGIETRLGESLRQLIADQRAQPVSAVIVFTDGGQNAGLNPTAAIQLAHESKIPVYLVGLGSARRPVSADRRLCRAAAGLSRR